MKGKHAFVVSSRFVKYEFEIKRNITIIQGDSATGKTTLLNMLDAYSVDSASSGIIISCDVPFFVYSSGGAADWKTVLQLNEGSIIFIEEDYDFVSSTEFAKFLEHSDSYFVIITRENLENLPYSVEEIYRIKESGKYGTTTQIYNIFENVYMDNRPDFVLGKESSEVNCVVTEDSQSGFQFFNVLCEKKQKQCIPAFGKSNIIKYIRENKNEKMLVIADGAAFGSQMRKITELLAQKDDKECIIFLPESFEWMLLKADFMQNVSGIQDILDNTYEYVDSKQYMSWERFYTALLIKESEGKVYHYNKHSLNEYFCMEKIVNKIKERFPILDKI